MAQLKDLIVNGATRLIGLLTATDINATNSLKQGGVNVSLEGHTHADYVNQNAFSNIKVGSTTVAADTATDTFELVAGSNISLTPDATNDKITIVATDTTYSTATTTANGLMSSADKSKLDGIAAGAEVNQNAFSTVKVGSSNIVADAKSDTIEIVAGSNITLTADVTNDKLTIAATNTTYIPASASPANVSTASAVGTSTSYARGDHVHAITLASGDSNGQIKIAGSNVSVKGLGTAAYTSSGSYSTATNWTNGTGAGSVKLTGGTASGGSSVAEGEETLASGTASHAEGFETQATNDCAHVEGDGSIASGYASHAEGQSIASGTYSHSEGYGTVANHKSQHAFGEYNTEDVNTNGATARGSYIEMVGNGTSSTNRSNARTLDWSGNEVLSGSMTVGTKAKLQYNSTTSALDFIFV